MHAFARERFECQKQHNPLPRPILKPASRNLYIGLEGFSPKTKKEGKCHPSGELNCLKTPPVRMPSKGCDRRRLNAPRRSKGRGREREGEGEELHYVFFLLF